MYIDADGRTRHSTLQALYNLIHTGSGGGSYTPVYLGGSVIYKVPPGMAGNNTAVIPALAGKDFLLRRSGNPLEPGTEYEILNAGGFKLMLPDDVFFEGEKFELDVFSLQTGPTPAPGGGGAPVVAVRLSKELFQLPPILRSTQLITSISFCDSGPVRML